MIPGVPYDAEVEYLESTGTQWIDTGYAFNSASDKVELVFELLTTTNKYKWIFGAYDSQKRLAIGSGDGRDIRTLGYNASTSYNNDAYYTDGAHIFLADSTGASIDGQNFFGFADFSTTSHILLYTIPLDPSGYCSNARIWSYKHYRNGVLIHDCIPVRFTNELGVSEGAMYDRVSKKLFRNQGTGAFVIGPDVATPVMGLRFFTPKYTARDYVQDGLIAMWDGIENAGWGVHDANATVWKDLVGSVDLGKNGTPIIGADYMSSYDGTSFSGYFANTPVPSWVASNQQITFEVVFRKVNDSISFLCCGGGCLNPMISANKIYLTTRNTKNISWQNDSARHVISVVTSSADYQSSSMINAYLDGAAASLLNGQYYTFAKNYGVYVGRGGGTLATNGCEVCAHRIYSKGLTASEIASNYAIDKARFNLP